jgi:type IV pilus assembly protein PilW
MKTQAQRQRERGLQHGVTLIELMVGLVIGLIGVLAITQVTALSEGQKRTTTGGSDAQVNGAISLHMLQRDLQTSGYGLTTFAGALGCTLKMRHSDGTNYSWTVAPVIITAGTSAANGNSDSVQILSSTRTSYSTPTRVSAAHTQTGNLFSVDSHIGVLACVVMLAAPETWSVA